MEESPLYWPLLYLAVNFEVENIFSSSQVSNSVYQMQRNNISINQKYLYYGSNQSSILSNSFLEHQQLALDQF